MTIGADIRDIGRMIRAGDVSAFYVMFFKGDIGGET